MRFLFPQEIRYFLEVAGFKQARIRFNNKLQNGKIACVLKVGGSDFMGKRLNFTDYINNFYSLII